MRRMKRLLACLVGIASLTACPKSSIVIYRSLSQPGAMQSCDANKQYHFEVTGKTEAEARSNGEAFMRKTVTETKGCGALIVNDGAGTRLDGGWNYAGNFQWCGCK
jgi:hypothetical protein